MAQAGSVFVEVVPSLRGFSKSMNSQLGGLGDVSVKVVGEVDDKKLKTDVLNAAKAAQATVEVDADIKEAQAKIDEVERNLDNLKKLASRDTPQLDLDIREAEAKRAKLQSDLESLGKEKASPEVDLRTAQLEAQLGRLDAQLSSLNGRKVTPEVTAGIATAEAELVAFQAQLRGLEGKREQILLDVDTASATEKLRAWADTAAKRAGEIKENVDVDTGAAWTKLLAFTATASKLSIGTLGIGAAVLAAGQLVSSLAPAAGLLPAIGVAGAAAMGTIKIGLSGVGDALKNAFDPTKAKQFNEALAKLSPNARDFVTSIRGMGGELKALRIDVQDRLFAGLGTTVKSLGANYLPIARSGFSSMAGSINSAVKEFAGWLNAPAMLQPMRNATDNVAQGFDHLVSGSLPAVGQAFTTLAGVGSSVLPGIGYAISGVAQQFNAWVQGLAADGSLYTFFDNVTTELGHLFQVVGNVGSIFMSVFTAASSTGGNFLTTLTTLTGQVAAFLRSAQGMNMLVGLFSGVQTALSFVSPLFSAIGSTLATVVLPAISSALPSIGQAIGSLAPVVAPLGQFIAALAPLVASMAVSLGTWLAGALQAVLPPLTAFLNFLSRSPGLALGLVGAIALIGKGFGPLMGLIGVIGKLVPLFAEGGAAAGLLGRAFTFLTGPIGIAIGIFTLLFTTSDAFRGAVMSLLGVLANLVGQLVSALMPAFQAILSAIMPVISLLGGVLGQVLATLINGAIVPLVNILVAALVPIINVVAGVFTQLIQAVLPPLMSIISALLPVIMLLAQVWVSLFQAVMPIYAVIGQLIAAVLPPLVGIITSVVVPVITFLANLLATVLVFAIQYLVIPALQFLMFIFTSIGPVITAVGGFFTWLWQSVIVPAWNGIMAVVSFVWNSILLPIFTAIGAALAFLGAVIFTILVAPFVIAWNIISAIVMAVVNGVLLPLWYGAIAPALNFLGGVFTWLWTAIVVPAWNGIVAAITFAWGIVSAVFGAIVGFIQGVLSAVFTWLWNSVIIPVWNGIVAAIQFAWGVIQAIWGALVAYIFGPIGAVFNWLWHNLIEPVWNGITAAIQAAWGFIQGVFNTLMAGVHAVGDAFQSVADWIGRAWDTIREAARKPVQWVVDVVYNNGIRAVWNGIASLFGMPQLGPVQLATGGVLPGYRPGVDSIPAVLSPGEGVLVPEAVRGLGPGFVGWANRTFSGGRSDGGMGTDPRKRYSHGGIAHFADGGIVGDIGDFLSGAGDFFMKIFTDPVGAVRDLFSKVTGDANNTPGTGGWTDALKKMPVKVIDAVIEKVKSWVSSLGDMGGGGGAGVQRWAGVASQALAMAGAPQSWLGLLLAQMQSESGGNPGIFNNWDSNAAKGTPSGGLMQVIQPTFDSYAGPLRGLGLLNPLANIYAAIKYMMARYGSPVGVWGQGHGYDSGGILPPGVSTAVNMTGGNEHLAVFTTGQWQMLGDLIENLAALPDTLTSLVSDLSSGITSLVTTLRATAATSATGATTGAGSIGAVVGGGIAAGVTAAVAPSVAAPPVKKPDAWGRAAQELLNWMNHGGQIFEDFSFRGSSSNLNSHNDDIADAYYREWGYRDLTVPSVKAFLQRYIAAHTFDSGGLSSGIGTMFKQTLSPERVLSPRQTQAFESLVPLLGSMYRPGGRIASISSTAAETAAGRTVIQNITTTQVDPIAVAATVKRREEFEGALAG